MINLTNRKYLKVVYLSFRIYSLFIIASIILFYLIFESSKLTNHSKLGSNLLALFVLNALIAFYMSSTVKSFYTGIIPWGTFIYLINDIKIEKWPKLFWTINLVSLILELIVFIFSLIHIYEKIIVIL